MIDSEIFAEVFGGIVAKVRALYDTANNKEPYYRYGHYQAIADELMSRDKSPAGKFEKYPLVILGIDPEYSETTVNDQQYSVSANIWIVGKTTKTMSTQDRFDQKFKGIIYPIYSLLKKEIINSKFVSSLGIQEVNPRSELFPYWGTQSVQGSQKQVLNDPLDALKFKVNDLLINIVKC